MSSHPHSSEPKKFGDIKNFNENIHSYEATTTGSQLVKYKIQVYNDFIKKTWRNVTDELLLYELIYSI